jgi:2-haloacid dehalogenase
MLDFSRFEVLTFDCYGTLINWEDGILRCLHRVLATHGKDTDDVTTLQCYGDFEAKAESGKYHSYREVLESVVKQFGERFGFPPTEQEAGSLAESLKGWEPWPDSVGALRELRNRFRIAIISNVDDDLFAVTEPKLGIKFNEVITAQQAQAYKPALKIFELALSRIAVPVGGVLHVGQSLYHDVIPAKSLGLATVWVNRPSARCGIGPVKAVDARPDFEVNSLAELVAACAKVGPPKRSKS